VITKGSRVQCVAHEGDHRGVVVAEYGADHLSVVWDLLAMRELSIMAWTASRAKCAADDGLTWTARGAVVEVASADIEA
jgi:hypothetical protein